MKNLALVFAFAFFSVAIQAQTTNADFRHEVGINVFSVLNYRTSRLTTQTYSDKRSFNGLIYNRYFGNNVIRSGFQFFQESTSEGFDDPTPASRFFFRERTTFKSLEGHLGYARGIRFGKLFPYIGLDGIFKHTIYRGQYESAGDFPPYYSKGNYHYKDQYIGLSPFIGVKFNPVNHFSVSIETSIIRQFQISNQDKRNEKKQMIFNPVSLLTLSYHFGKIKNAD